VKPRSGAVPLDACSQKLLTAKCAKECREGRKETKLATLTAIRSESCRGIFQRGSGLFLVIQLDLQNVDLFDLGIESAGESYFLSLETVDQV
jgi:hypothetical protein